MNRVIYFKTTMMDSVALTGATSYNLFDGAIEDEDSVTKFTENDAVRWLIANQFIKDEFAREFFPSPASTIFLTNLVEPFTWHDVKPGDIDLLLANLENPSKAIAFECKRVKIVSQAVGPPKINGVKQLASAISQVNAYQDIGFHQTYLLIILLDDGRDTQRSTQCSTMQLAVK